jgi:SsrA-binding protein
VLSGTEVKSLRAGRASLADGFAQISDGEVWLHNVHIPEYTQGTWTNHDVRRTRKLLLHRKEIDKLASETAEQGLTLVPLELYFKDGKAKVELGLGRGKRTYDKRHDLAARDAAREVDRALRRRRLRGGGRCPSTPVTGVAVAATPAPAARSVSRYGPVAPTDRTDPTVPLRLARGPRCRPGRRRHGRTTRLAACRCARAGSG